MDLNLLFSFADVKGKILPILIAVLFFGVIITIHEFGHFIFAKIFGVKVNEFAIGMGPTLLKKQGKETKYALRLFPIGGFVSMEGEDEESSDSRAFCNQKVWKRMIIIAAGATFNLILGLIVCFFLVGSEDLVGTTKILQFYEGAVSNQEAGLMEGDRIIKIDGKRVFSDYDISFLMQRNGSGSYEFAVEREGENITLHDVKFAKRTSGNFSYNPDCTISNVSANMKDFGFKDGDKIVSVNGEKVTSGEELIAAIGKDGDYILDFTVEREGENINLSEVEMMTVTVFDFVILGEDKNVFNVTKNAFGYAFSLGRMVYLSLFDLLRGQYGMNDLAGPIGTISVITDIAEESIASVDWSQLFMIMAMITINIGLFNLLPVPALDGGHLFFMFFELIFRKKIPQKYESYIHAAGLVILFGIMAITSASDIWKLISGRGFY
ncbi:MAG: RIP metalloprotease RseP [Clostridia bacterium]|nr:RIP metalloprotease RseP [Clostridia bacterium]